MRWPGIVEQVATAAIRSAGAGTPTVLDITGPSGYGKSSLARWVTRQFPAGQVLRATALADDRAETLGVLRHLDPDLPVGDTNPLRVARHVGRLIDARQAAGPVVLMIDDLQWADPESVKALGVLVERMAGDRVLVVTAHRLDGPHAVRWARHADTAAAVFRIRLDGLDDESALALIRQDRPDASPDLARHLRRHTGGRPLSLRSLVQEYSTQALAAMAEAGRLPAPSDLVALMRDRLTRLEPDAVAVLEALAVLGDGGADVFVIAAVADVADVDRVLGLLVAQRLVLVEDEALPRARLFHGALRAAVYATVPAPARQRLHGRAAARLPGRRDRLHHRVAAARATDDGLAADLDAYADDLHRERRYRAAARIRRQAAALSSTPEARARRDHEADFDAVLAVDLDAVTTSAGQADAEPQARFTLGARLVVERRYVAAAELLESLSDDDLASLGDLTAYRARVLRGWAMVSAGHSPAGALADLTAAQRSAVTDPALDGYLAIALGQAVALATPPADLADFRRLMAAERAALAATPAGLARLAWRGSSMALSGIQRMAIADLDIVISRLGDGIVDFGDGVFYAFQGLAYFFDGQWGRAAIGIDLARAGAQGRPAPLTATLLPLAAVIAGDAEAARTMLAEARRLRVQSPQPAAVSAADIVEVVTAALLGTPAERRRWLERRTADVGDPLVQPPLTIPLISMVTQSIAATWAGRTDAARVWAGRLRSTPLTSWTGPVADWLEARTEDDRTFVEQVEPLSVAGLPEIPVLAALLHADLRERATGAVHRAADQRLRQALADFGGQGLLSAPFGPEPVDRTSGNETAEMSPVLAALTDREREIATLLLEGMSYAQIGRELFVTRSTVSFHLTRIYAKTGTSSRHELAHLIHLRKTMGRAG
ncbi:LuxR C-terminal-related transcriptional regulator [Nakamurella sp.]|uniref:ATP-binding protein n=1 Tax=Nakamurella sp. TaxID=1869182 RepID=UPI003B3A6535